MRFDWRFWVGAVTGAVTGLPGRLRRCLALRRVPACTRPAVHGLAHDMTRDRARDMTHQQALALVRAVDAGGLPLHPARVNQIARQLGLEVSSAAPVDQTVARIRAALTRLG